MDQENMNQENRFDGHESRENEIKDNVVSEQKGETVTSEHTSSEARASESEQRSDSAPQTTYHLEREAIPVQKEYVSGQPENYYGSTGQGSAFGGQNGMSGQENTFNRQSSMSGQGSAFSGQSSGQSNGYNSYQGSTYQQSGSFGANGQSGNPYQSSSSYGQNVYTGTVEEPKKKKKAKKAKTKKQGSGKAKKVVSFVASAAAFGLIAGGVMFGVNALGNKALNKNTKVTEVPTVTTTDSGMRESQSESNVADVVEETMPSIVSITNKSVQVVRSWFQSYEQEVQGAGSGIIIGQTDDEILIATNNHVIDGARELTVTFCDEESVEAVVKDTDDTMDLAVVAVKVSDMEKDTIDSIKVAALGSSDDLRVGESAIAIGNALGYGQSVTVGYISALNREVDADGMTQKMIQTDAAINPGNSGGALLNSRGEVIGINTMKYAETTVEGMGYAIPISKAIPVINDMMNQKVIKESEQGYLGIQGSDITDEYATNFNMPTGVYVVKIIDDSPADQCGLKAGDIITKFGDREVSSMEGLQSILSKKEAGEKIEMIVQRNDEKGEYKEITLEVTLGAKKDMPSTKEEKSSKSNKKSDADDEDADDSAESEEQEDEDKAQDENEGYPDEGERYYYDDGNGSGQMDPEEFFRQFEQYFNR